MECLTCHKAAVSVECGNCHRGFCENCAYEIRFPVGKSDATVQVRCSDCIHELAVAWEPAHCKQCLQAVVRQCWLCLRGFCVDHIVSVRLQGGSQFMCYSCRDEVAGMGMPILPAQEFLSSRQRTFTQTGRLKEKGRSRRH